MRQPWTVTLVDRGVELRRTFNALAPALRFVQNETNEEGMFLLQTSWLLIWWDGNALFTIRRV